MNKQEMMIAAVLGALLVGYVIHSGRNNLRQAEQARVQTGGETAAATNLTATVRQPALALPPAASVSDPVPLEEPDVPAELVTLENGELQLTLSSHGAVLDSVLLKQFNTHPGEGGADNPPVLLDFTRHPAFRLQGIPGVAPNAVYRIERGADGLSATFRSVALHGLAVERRLELLENYQIRVSDTFRNLKDAPLAIGTNQVCIGSMYRGQSKNDVLSIDALPDAEKAGVLHWDKDKRLRGFVGGAGGFGCGGSKSALGMPDRVDVPISGAQQWVAVKSRFFVTAFSSTAANCGYEASLERDVSQEKYILSSLAARVRFPGAVVGGGESLSREYTLYVGPKKLDLLKSMGNDMDAVMQFGTFKWFCKLLVPTLNFFYRIIPNYGIAIILLTILVRIIFWPLTHKSTQSMRRMQEIQPEIKALQAKYKENPQKLQQETWAVYKKHKVNPMSSCLPMLIQIPVFIALFTVLRSAVELRYASFLWIADLSEPENLFAGSIPLVGALNILPVFMSGTMALQSYLTPSAGDPQQQKMMMIMMPIMMLFMFYSFPSALSLYWTVSQVLAIVQMLMMRRHHAPPKSGDGIEDAQVVPPTRQQRRQSARG
jgi:YidC/Oxa1 family membrane protein insertase